MGSSREHLVVVTGAGSGIGAAIARRYAHKGSQLIVADIDEAAADRTVYEIEREGGSAYAYRLDVVDAAAWDAFAAGVRDDHGVPDVLVNNAGILISGSFLDHDAADWERIVGVNLMGVVHGCRVFGAQMKARARADRALGIRSQARAPSPRRSSSHPAGHIVNIASAAAFIPLRSAPAYAVTKAAVLMLSECLRIELAGDGIGVTAICPTVIKTNIARHGTVAGDDEELAGKVVSTSAALQDRFAWTSPDKVARAVARSVSRNWAIVPVNPDAWLAYAAHRISPGLVRAVARAASFENAISGVERLFPRVVEEAERESSAA